MKPSEYGGSDTENTNGIQPPPHKPTAQEKLRLLYSAAKSDEPVTIDTGDKVND